MDDQPGIEVFLNVYDVVPPDPQGTINSAQTAPITRLNNLVRDGPWFGLSSQRPLHALP